MQVAIPRGVGAMLVEARRVLREPALVLWCAYLVLFPFYVFKSGVPQPGDMLVIFMLPLAVRGWSSRLNRFAVRSLRALALFTGWVFFINYAYAIGMGRFGLFGKETFILVPIFYLYNAIVFFVVLVFYERYGARFLWLTLHVVLACACLQVVISFVLAGAHGRGMLFFNNPNQLGFYALLSASILAYGRRRLGFGAVKAAVGLLACTYLTLLSASKAALLGTALLVAFTVFSNPRTLILATVASLALLFAGGPVADALDRAQARIDAQDQQQYGFLEQRGYDRITNHQEYWLLGAGEGGLDRFADTTVIGDHELHSAAGTIFFCYGIVGTSFFLFFLFRLVQGASIRNAIMLIPALSYSLAHQGMRFTLLWVLFGVFISLKHQSRIRS
ncbi:MAG TPA: hypothetical protein VL463_31540 [Kofleriaceae bacterium]|nr:hypothetical protein [Kofleriaceae bacterium]